MNKYVREKLGQVVSFRTGKLNSNAAKIDGMYPFFTCSQETFKTDTYSFDTECVLLAGNNANGIYSLKYFNGKFDAYQRTYVIEPLNRKDLSARFLYYALRPTLELLRSISTGAATKFLTLTILRDIVIPVPQPSIQQRIAAVLSAYDDLIENNTRRIQILEEMVRRFYDEWFVCFRFPGHESVGMAESELGLVPDGWEVHSVTEMIEFDPRTTVPREGLKRFIPMSSLAENSMLITSVESRAGNSGSKFKNGDTLLARITPCLENGKTGFVDFLPDDSAVAFGSTEYIVLRSKTVTPEFVYLTARSDKFRQHAIKSMSGATGRQRVRVDSFNEYMLAQPDKDTLDKFSELVLPAFKTIGCLAKKSANLRRTRDLLLPKLISGEIDVSNFPEPGSH